MAVRESVGAIPCLCCGQSVPVKRSASGALSVSCPWCDLSAYAKDGTQAHRRILAALPKSAPEAPSTAAPETTPRFKPAFA